MALNWMDFVWTIKRWQQVKRKTPASGDYTISTDDVSLISSNTSAATWTLPIVAGNGQVLKIKNKGSAALTLSGTIFTNATVTDLVLSTGDMVTLSDDGVAWSVGD